MMIKNMTCQGFEVGYDISKGLVFIRSTTVEDGAMSVYAFFMPADTALLVAEALIANAKRQQSGDAQGEHGGR